MNQCNSYDKYLSQSKKLSNYCKSNENILHEILKMDIDEASKVHLLDLVGVEISRILKFIERLKSEKETVQNFVSITDNSRILA